MKIGPHYSAGCRDLLAILKRRGRGSKAALARSLRRADGEALDGGTLANILSGRRPMGLDVAVQIEASEGIACAAWTMPVKARAGK